MLIYNSTILLVSTDTKPFKNQKNISHPQKNTPEIKEALSHYPLFGNHIPLLLTDKNIPSTLLNFSLMGILKASNPIDSQALIKVGDEIEQLYFVNDSLPNDIVLYQILNNAVLLKRDNKIEKLSLPKETLNTKNNETELEDK